VIQSKCGRSKYLVTKNREPRIRLDPSGRFGLATSAETGVRRKEADIKSHVLLRTRRRESELGFSISLRSANHRALPVVFEHHLGTFQFCRRARLWDTAVNSLLAASTRGERPSERGKQRSEASH
jgi:hypothetical protein